MPSKRVLSGIQPSGDIHIGNYLGALRQWVDLQNEAECFYCIVNLHAITVKHDPDLLRSRTIDAAATLIALGIDTDKSVLFKQSDNPNHSELAWILSCVGRIGWLNRMTQFKDKANKDREKASVGLYTYPLLMAADIICYQASHVPIGEDQKQHLELARDLVDKFNSDFSKDVLVAPEPLILGKAARVMSLRDGNKKMSKSDSSEMTFISLTDDNDMIAKKIQKAKTDPEPLPNSPEELTKRPEALNLVTIASEISNKSAAEILKNHDNFRTLKEELIQILQGFIDPLRKERSNILNDKAQLAKILENGAEKARSTSQSVLSEVRKAIGL